MSCNEKVLKLNHWKVELDSTNTHTYIELELAIERAPGLLNLIEFNLTKAEQVSALTKYHTHTRTHWDHDQRNKSDQVSCHVRNFMVFEVHLSRVAWCLVSVPYYIPSFCVGV